MFHTNRRANVANTPGVTWVHGTRIGIAESSDGGATWEYRGTPPTASGVLKRFYRLDGQP